ncbi:MAG: hypothetical protein U5N86_00135 [Planctomycetota bacterium]|nr:hypothetical protein [Planctomycetota bacterium]
MKTTFPAILLVLLFALACSACAEAPEEKDSKLSVTSLCVLMADNLEEFCESGGFALISPANDNLFVARSKGAQTKLLLNSKDITPDGCTGFISAAFAPDNTLAFAYSTHEGCFVSVRERQQKFGSYRSVRENSLLFSPDSKRLAFIAGVQRPREAVVLDGEKGEGYTEICEFIFSRDSRRFGFIGRNGNEYALVVKGKVSDRYTAYRNLRFSTARRGYAVMAMDKGEWFPLLGSRRGAGCFGAASEFVFDSRGKRCVFVAETEEGKVLFENGKPTKWTDVQRPFFGPRDKLTFVQTRKGRQFPVVDGAALKSYDRVRLMLFSPDGKRFIHTAFMGQMEVMMENGSFDEEFHHVIEPVFTPDGGHLAFAGQFMKDVTLVVDKLKPAICKGTDAFAVTISDDAKHSALFVVNGERVSLVVDGKQLAEYYKFDPWCFGAGFTAYRAEQAAAFARGEIPEAAQRMFRISIEDGGFRYFAVQDGKFVRVEGEFK